MDGRKQSQLSGRGNVAAVAGVAWGLFLIAWGTGCSDHRMSLAEFIQLEQEMREASAPTTQPAATLRAAGELINRQLGPYKVGPRDVIIVSLTGLAQEAPYAPLQARVDRNGQIELPAVGPVQVADLELEDVEDAIQAAYVPKVFREVTVHVSLLEADTTNVLALGAVQTPGLVPLRRTERNLLFSIAGAGGASEAASGRGGDAEPPRSGGPAGSVGVGSARRRGHGEGGGGDAEHHICRRSGQCPRSEGLCAGREDDAVTGRRGFWGTPNRPDAAGGHVDPSHAGRARCPGQA